MKDKILDLLAKIILIIGGISVCAALIWLLVIMATRAPLFFASVVLPVIIMYLVSWSMERLEL